MAQVCLELNQRGLADCIFCIICAACSSVTTFTPQLERAERVQPHDVVALVDVSAGAHLAQAGHPSKGRTDHGFVQRGLFLQ
jgi:hypothetical protein